MRRFITNVLLLTVVVLPGFAHALSLGDSAPEVKTLQAVLNELGYTVTNYGEETSFFGPSTEAALTRYQIDNAAAILGGFGIMNNLGELDPLTTKHLMAKGEVKGISTDAFSVNLVAGMIHPDVARLQTFLNERGFTVASFGPGSKGFETTYFGKATAAAVKRYQEAHASTILTPNGLTSGTGHFLSSTRTQVNEALLSTTKVESTSSSNLAAVSTTSTRTLTIYLRGSGTVTTSTGQTCSLSPCVLTVPYKTRIRVTASPLAGNTFSSWSGNCTGTSSVCSITMSRNRTVTATFTRVDTPPPPPSPTTYSLTVGVTGQGSVSGTGVSCPSDCSESFNSGTIVTLTAAAQSGYSFSGWTGACSGTQTSCTVSMTQAQNVGASFAANPPPSPTVYTLTVTPPSNGTITGRGISCPGDCTESVDAGTAVTLSASPASGYNFSSWTGDCTNTASSCALTMNGNKSVSATFTVSSSGGGTPQPTACGTDIGGWTIPTPTPVVGSTAAERKSLTQVGTRIHYISAVSGNDSTADLYFWNGSSIIDSNGSSVGADGRPYGNDPMNPTGQIKPFKRWAHVAPRRSASYDIGSNSTPGEARPGTRAGYPDWFLFNRGETFDVKQDIESFWKEKNPTWDGTTQVYGSLSLSAGKSATERKIMGAYGDLCKPRPRFIHPIDGFVSIMATSYDPMVTNVAYLSLHFDGHSRPYSNSSYTALTLLGQSTASNMLFEDVWFDGAALNIQNEGVTNLRRVLVTDSFGTGGGHVQGMFYGGTGKKAQLHIEDSIWLRNGFRNQDPKTMSWPPSGTNTWDIFNRNMYVSGYYNPTQTWMRDTVSMIGTSGDQFRSGGILERNFFYQGYVMHGGYNGAYVNDYASTGAIRDNVVQHFVGTGTNDNRGHPGWGFGMSGFNVEVTRNIITNPYPLTTSYRALSFVPASTDCIAGETYIKGKVSGNVVHNNVLDSGTGIAGVEIADGVSTSQQTCMQWTYPGITGNTVRDNTIINSKLKEWASTPGDTAVGMANDTTFTNNAIYADRTAAASAKGWTGQDRTLKSYLQSKGVSVSSADGFPEYFNKAVTMKRGNWNPDWTAKPLVNYFRSGFGFSQI